MGSLFKSAQLFGLTLLLFCSSILCFGQEENNVRDDMTISLTFQIPDKYPFLKQAALSDLDEKFIGADLYLVAPGVDLSWDHKKWLHSFELYYNAGSSDLNSYFPKSRSIATSSFAYAFIRPFKVGTGQTTDILLGCTVRNTYSHLKYENHTWDDISMTGWDKDEYGELKDFTSLLGLTFGPRINADPIKIQLLCNLSFYGFGYFNDDIHQHIRENYSSPYVDSDTNSFGWNFYTPNGLFPLKHWMYSIELKLGYKINRIKHN